MKLASYTESHLAKRLSALLVKAGPIIGFALFCLGILSYAVLLRPENVRYQFFDENALLTGLVKREFRDHLYLTQLSRQYRNTSSSSVISWIEKVLDSSGFEVYHQNFTSHHHIAGSNIYGILRAGRSSSTEALVLLAPDRLNEDINYGVVLLLGLANYLSVQNYWAKDIIILVTSNGIVGAQAWLNAYLGINNPSIKSESLTGRSGGIQFVINLELAIDKGFSFVNIIPEGINSILPNLDLVFVASKLCEAEGMDFGFYTTSNEIYATTLAVMSHQATGLPFNNHALFLKHRIDSLTLQVLPSFNKVRSSRSLLSLARSLEGILRTLNNLLERLHHSEFFYIMTSPVSFLSIGQYSPFFSLFILPLALESLRQWVLRNNNNDQAKQCREKLNIPPSLNIPLKPLLSLLSLSIVNGAILFIFPTLFSFLSPNQLLIGFMSLCLVMTLGVIFFRPAYTMEELCITRCLVLLVMAIGLYGLSLMHFALSLVLVLFFSIPLSLLTHNTSLFRFIFLLFSPPIVSVYVCLLYNWLSFTSSNIFEDSFLMLANGLKFAYDSYVLSGAWLFPILSFLVFPIWWICWVLSCADIVHFTKSKTN